MSIINYNNDFYPMLILANYNNKHEKLSKELKNDLKNKNLNKNKSRALNECIKEIDK